MRSSVRGTAPPIQIGEYGDGWMGQFVKNPDTARKLIGRIRDHADAAGRDPSSIGMQLSLAPYHEEDGKGFSKDVPRMVARMVELRELGFDWTSINGVSLFQAGYRSVDALLDYLREIHAALAPELAADSNA